MRRLLSRPAVRLLGILAIGMVVGALWHWLWLFPFPQLSVWKAHATGTVPVDPVPPSKIPGRWRPARRAPLTEDERARQIEELQTVGYLAGSRPATKERGVIRHVKGRVQPGLNLVVSAHRPEALLTDLDGRVLHDWRCAAPRAFGWTDDQVVTRRGGTCWRRVRMEPDGDLFAIFDGTGIIKIDRDSKPIWGAENGAHHDLDVAEDGRIFVLARTARVIPRIRPDRPSNEDFVRILSPEGKPLREISLLEALEASQWKALARAIPDQGDILHPNTIEIIDRDPADPLSPFRKGRVLISICYISTVIVLDLEEGIVWLRNGHWYRQHQPTMLANGRVMIFDNDGIAGHSRVIEFDPLTMKTHWLYRGSEAEPFFTPSCGSCQRLPNGNTLITESDPGRAFEVTPEGDIVWEYMNPHRAGEDDELVATLFEVVRLPGTERPAWLTDGKGE